MGAQYKIIDEATKFSSQGFMRSQMLMGILMN